MDILYDGNIIVESNFLSKLECQKIVNWMNNFNYNDLPNHSIEFWHKRLIARDTTTLIPGYENSFNEVNDILNNVKKRILNVIILYLLKMIIIENL